MKEEQPSSLEGAEAYGRMGKKAVHDFMEKFTKARPTIAASCDSTKLWTFPWVFGVCFAWKNLLVAGTWCRGEGSRFGGFGGIPEVQKRWPQTFCQDPVLIQINGSKIIIGKHIIYIYIYSIYIYI